jgi:hypothetical protein
MPDVVMQTDSGEFSLDAVSGGISAILDLAWQVYMYSTAQAEFCVVIDEPENHLHPELQQTLMPALLQAFPQAQFIIATHNPFMVSSEPDSSVFVLRFDAQRQVSSELLDMANKAGTANEILRDVLGLDFTLPIWASKKIDELVSQLSAPIDQTAVSALHEDLAALGLSDTFGEAVTRLIDEVPNDTAE